MMQLLFLAEAILPKKSFTWPSKVQRSRVTTREVQVDSVMLTRCLALRPILGMCRSFPR